MNRTSTLWIWIGGLILTVLVVCAIGADWIATHDPNVINLDDRLVAPSAMHLFGTDSLGRDLFSRLVHGARISIYVGFGAVGIAVVIGMVLGLVAGWYGKLVDRIIMGFVDVMLCFPSMFLLLAIIAMIGPGLKTIIVILGATSWMGVARLVRAEVLTLREREYIQAARIMGFSAPRIMFRHLLPNALSPVLVSATLGVGAAILAESGLSFLGLGIQPPISSWGNLLTEAKGTMTVAWWQATFPGLAILVTVLGFTLLGEGLRNRLGRS